VQVCTTTPCVLGGCGSGAILDAVKQKLGMLLRLYLYIIRRLGCLGGAAVRHRTRDQKVAGTTPGRGTIKSTRSTQPSIPPG